MTLDTGEGILVALDLAKDGYLPLDVAEEVSLGRLVKVMETLGRFHATSAAHLGKVGRAQLETEFPRLAASVYNTNAVWQQVNRDLQVDIYNGLVKICLNSNAISAGILTINQAGSWILRAISAVRRVETRRLGHLVLGRPRGHAEMYHSREPLLGGRHDVGCGHDGVHLHVQVSCRDPGRGHLDLPPVLLRQGDEAAEHHAAAGVLLLLLQ